MFELCSVICVGTKMLTRSVKGDVSVADLQSALMLIKCSPSPPPSRQLDCIYTIYTKELQLQQKRAGGEINYYIPWRTSSYFNARTSSHSGVSCFVLSYRDTLIPDVWSVHSLGLVHKAVFFKSILLWFSLWNMHRLTGWLFKLS